MLFDAMIRHGVSVHDAEISHAWARETFIDYLAAVELLTGRRGTLIGALEQQVGESSHAAAIARLRCFRGIDTLSAAGVCAEIGDFGRFPRPPRLAGFLGIVPSERTSDTKRRQGQITKAGPGHARRLLVEAAHHYRYQPRIGKTLARRQHGQDPRVIEVAGPRLLVRERLQQRLGCAVVAGRRGVEAVLAHVRGSATPGCSLSARQRTSCVSASFRMASLTRSIPSTTRLRVRGPRSANLPGSG